MKRPWCREVTVYGFFKDGFPYDVLFANTRYVLGKGANNQNGNLRWYLPLGVDPPRHFLPHFFSFAIESYIYETDFTLQKYHF